MVSTRRRREKRIDRYPISGEINRSVPDINAVFGSVKSRYESAALSVDETDGISYEFENWRFNLRASNTEPVVRLNVETKGDRAGLQLSALNRIQPGHRVFPRVIIQIKLQPYNTL